MNRRQDDELVGHAEYEFFLLEILNVVLLVVEDGGSVLGVRAILDYFRVQSGVNQIFL